jgi:hypothetical protein
MLTIMKSAKLWMLYLRLPTSISREAREQQKLKHEVVQLKREMNATSSQDEFAKWAKLRRRHDKALEEFEAKSALIVLPNIPDFLFSPAEFWDAYLFRYEPIGS